MAVVYLARDVKHERRVAIKVLKPELSATIGAERFLREIRVAAQLQHPNILGLYDSGVRRRPPLLRDAVHRGRVPSRPADPGAPAPDRGRPPDRPRSRRSPAVCPRTQDHPPRHQAREHPAAGRPCPGGRLRHRQGGRVGAGSKLTETGHGGRHAPLHEPRAVARRRHGRAERRVQPWVRALRTAGGPAAVRRTECHGGARAALAGAGARACRSCGIRFPMRSRTRPSARWRRRRPIASRP